MEKLEVLKRSDLFRELDDKQLAVVVEMSVTEVYEPGTVIHRQNTMLSKLYVIEEGLVGIILEPGQLSSRQIQAACNFETFGWEAVIAPYLATATAQALEKTKTLAFKGSDLLELCDTQPKLGCPICRAVTRVVAERLYAAYMQCLGVTAQD